MAPGLESATTASDGHAVVTVRGDIAADTAIELWQHLSYLVSQGHQHIVLDVGGMVLIDSTGVEVLARVAEWARRNGGDLELRSAGAGPPGRGPPPPSCRRPPLTGPRDGDPTGTGPARDL